MADIFNEFIKNTKQLIDLFHDHSCAFDTVDSMVTCKGTSFPDGAKVKFGKGITSSLPLEVQEDVEYEVVASQKDTFQIKDSEGNIVQFSTTGSGKMFCKYSFTEEQMKYLSYIQLDNLSKLYKNLDASTKHYDNLDVLLNDVNKSVVPVDMPTTSLIDVVDRPLEAEIYVDDAMYYDSIANAYLMGQYRIYTDYEFKKAADDMFPKTLVFYAIGTGNTGSATTDVLGWTPAPEAVDVNGDGFLDDTEKLLVKPENFWNKGMYYMQFIKHKSSSGIVPLQFNTPYHMSLKVYDAYNPQSTEIYHDSNNLFYFVGDIDLQEMDPIRITSNTDPNNMPGGLSVGTHTFYYVKDWNPDQYTFYLVDANGNPLTLTDSQNGTWNDIFVEIFQNKYIVTSNSMTLYDSVNNPPNITFSCAALDNNVKITIVDNTGENHGFYIEKTENGYWHRFQHIGTIGINETPKEYIDDQMIYGAYYRVRPFKFDDNQIIKMPYLPIQWGAPSNPPADKMVVKDLMATVLSSSQIMLNWRHYVNDYNNILNNSSLKIERRTKTGGVWGAYQRMGENGVDVSNSVYFAREFMFYYDGSVSPNTTYMYKVSFANAASGVETPEVTTMTADVGNLYDMMHLSTRDADTPARAMLNDTILQKIKDKRNPNHPSFDPMYQRQTNYWFKANRNRKASSSFFNNAEYWKNINYPDVNHQFTAPTYFYNMVLAYYLSDDADKVKFLDRVWEEFTYNVDIPRGMIYKKSTQFLGYNEYNTVYMPALTYDWLCPLFKYMTDGANKRQQLEQWIVNRLGSYAFRINTNDNPDTHIEGLYMGFRRDDIGIGNNVIRSMTSLLLAFVAANIPETITCKNCVDVSFLASNKVSKVHHGLSNGTTIKFTTTAGGVTAGQTYYVIHKTDNDFQVSTNGSDPVVTLAADATNGYYLTRDSAYGKTAKELSNKVLGLGIASLYQSMNLLDPTGGWMAGTGYIFSDTPGFTESQIITEEFLGANILDIYNHEDPRFGYALPDNMKIGQGYREIPFYPMYMRYSHGEVNASGTISKYATTFRYGDNFTIHQHPMLVYYLGDKANKELNTTKYFHAIKQENDMDFGVDEESMAKYLIYHVSTGETNEPLPEARTFIGKETQLCAMLSSWEEEFPAHVCIRAGGYIYDHTHFDKGTYEFHAKAVRWTEELGYTGSWMYRREDRPTCCALGHNTLILNQIDQTPRDCPITLDAENKICQVDLTPAYYGHVVSANRTFHLIDRDLEIKDDVQLKAPMAVRKQFITSAHVNISEDQKTLMLTIKRRLDGKIVEYYVVIDPEDNYTWDVQLFRPWEPGLRFDTLYQYQSSLKMVSITAPPSSNLSVSLKYTFKEML